MNMHNNKFAAFLAVKYIVSMWEGGSHACTKGGLNILCSMLLQPDVEKQIIATSLHMYVPTGFGKARQLHTKIIMLKNIIG